MKRKLLSRGYLVTMEAEAAMQPQCGFVGIEGERIALVSYDEAEALEWVGGDGEVIDCTGCVVMPGLINTHSHISMTLLRNYADDMELSEWLNDYIWVFEAHLTEEDIYNGARLAIVEMLQGGTTSFVDMYFQEHTIAKAVKELGIRALLTECVLDFNRADYTERLDKLRAAAADCSRIDVGVAPHAPYTCDRETLALAVDYAAKYDLPMTVHLSETATERAMVESARGLSPLDYLVDCGAVTDRTILAHSIYLTDEEIASIAKLGASVAYNAQSNMKLASGIAPVVAMQSEGVNCTIATDGASSNNDLDMWDEMRSAALLQRVSTLSPTAMSAYEVLYAATRGGAKAIGKGSELGSLTVGYRADLLVVDLGKPHNRPLHNIISALVYSVKSSDVREVYIDGEKIEISTELQTEIIASAERSVSRIISEL